ncbi:MAG: HK97 gp10 family phage protein [Acidimicrobiales bacterium]
MVTVITLDLDFVALNRVGIDLADSLMTQATLGTAIHATRSVPVVTGELRFSQRHRTRRIGLRAEGLVWYTADHAMAVHEGAKPHVIRPRRPGGVLVFQHHGRTRYAKRVFHPGNLSNPWLYRALLAQAGQLGFRVSRSRGLGPI